jgi:MoaA/NifB/PqqE/SkfB family radical SAM enzyme
MEISDSLEGGNKNGAAFLNPNRLQFTTPSHLKVRAGPSGVHFFDRTTGLNVLLDEVRVPPVLWAAAPRQVSVALTNACDLACPYCFAPKHPAALDVEQVARWLGELDANGCLGVGFGGGEPTLYRRLVELCHYTAQKTGLAVTFTTHAHRLDDALIAALAGNVHFVRVSMDGVGATYEAIRGRSFAALRRRLETMRSLAPFGVNFVVNARTLPDLDVAIAVAAEAGASEFLLLPEHPTRGGGGIDNHTAEALRRWVSHYRGVVPLTISELEAGGLPICDPLARETGLRVYAHIDADGILKRSSYESAGVAIGNDGVIRALCTLRTRLEEK